jgi:hypothetical protein
LQRAQRHAQRHIAVGDRSRRGRSGRSRRTTGARSQTAAQALHRSVGMMWAPCCCTQASPRVDLLVGAYDASTRADPSELAVWGVRTRSIDCRCEECWATRRLEKCRIQCDAARVRLAAVAQASDLGGELAVGHVREAVPTLHPRAPALRARRPARHATTAVCSSAATRVAGSADSALQSEIRSPIDGSDTYELRNPGVKPTLQATARQPARDRRPVPATGASPRDRLRRRTPGGLGRPHWPAAWARSGRMPGTAPC